MKFLIFIFLFLGVGGILCVNSSSQTITSIAGTGVPGYSGDGGPATAAQINSLVGAIAIDTAGNIFFSDFYNNRIRKIDVTGIITTVVGTATRGFGGDGGSATAAQIALGRSGLVFDKFGNLYFSDSLRIRRISTTGIVSTYAGTGSTGPWGDGGPATAAFVDPSDLCFDTVGNLYFGSSGTVRKIDTAGFISAFAGNVTLGPGYSGDGGQATAARLNLPYFVASDSLGNIYIADHGNYRVRKVNPSGVITTVAGTGYCCSGDYDCTQATASLLYIPSGLKADRSGNLYITDELDHRLRKVNSNGIITALAGNGVNGYSGDNGPALSAEFYLPVSLVLDKAGNMYVGDFSNSRIRKFSINNITPHFTNGNSQYITVCTGSAADSVNTLLAIIDSEAGKTVTWSVAFNPTHGSLTGADSTTSTGGVVLPTGLYYSPSSGFSGNDSFKIQVADCGGVSDITTVHVTVVSSLSSVSISGSACVCMATAITLTPSLYGGIWSSGATGIATVGSSSGTVTGITAGVTTITYSLSIACGSVTAYKTITVNALPGAFTGTPVVCAGFTSTLGSTVGGTWTSGNTTIATIGSLSGIAVGIAAGIAPITYTLPTGCQMTGAVTVNPLPAAISGPTTVCVSGTAALYDSITGGLWSCGSSNATIGSSSGIVSGVSVGTATITYTMPTGCYTTKLITVNPLPSAISGPSAVCMGTSVTLTTSSTGGMWSANNSFAAIGSASGSVSGVGAGIDTISYIIPTGCAVSKIITVNVTPTAILGTASVCAGATTALSNPTSGGAWTSSNVSIATIGSASGIAAGIAAGPAIITYALPTGCAAYRIITVNIAPVAITGTLNVCLAGSVALSDGTGSGVWSSSSPGIAGVGSSTGIVTGASAGVSTISYTLANGCFATAVVTVNPPPAPITGAGSLCTGATLTLSSSPVGGTWTSGTTGVASIGSTSGILNGITAGTSTITYTLSTGCLTTSVVTVNISPTAITGLPYLCIGLTTALSNGVPSGSWSSLDPSVATVDSATGIVTGLALGVDAISYTMPGGCNVYTIITVNPVPTPITGIAAVCVLGTTTLHDGVSGGIWTSGSTGIATVGTTSGIVSGISGGSATITYSMGAGCNAFMTVSVTPAPSPITGTFHICQSATTTLGSLTTGGLWSSSNTALLTIGASTGLAHAVSAGVVTISYTMPTTCFSSKTITVNPLTGVHPEGLEDIDLAGSPLKVVPNPTNGEFTITGILTTVSAQPEAEIAISLTDVLGREVYTATRTAQYGIIDEHITLPGKLTSGMYLLIVRSGTEKKVLHVMVSR